MDTKIRISCRKIIVNLQRHDDQWFELDVLMQRKTTTLMNNRLKTNINRGIFRMETYQGIKMLYLLRHPKAHLLLFIFNCSVFKKKKSTVLLLFDTYPKNISCKAQVISIISAGVEQNNVNLELGWSDDEEDVQVENLVKCIEEVFSFSNSHFTGGATKADVIQMRDEAKKENKTCKTARANPKQHVSHAIDADNNISKLC
ncbi:hypothetical protein Bca101_031357 [Brassica carinata]